MCRMETGGRRQAGPWEAWRRGALAVLLLVLGGLPGGCDRGPEGLDAGRYEDPKEAARVAALIQQLSAAEQADTDDGAWARYVEAREALIPKGKLIQAQLIEALNGDDSWGVRFGTVEVLTAVGDTACVESLIGAVADPHPQVAQMALELLRAISGHRIVLETGTGPAGIPAVPKRTKDEPVSRDWELWSLWQAEHGIALEKAWRDWWKTNQKQVKTD